MSSVSSFDFIDDEESGSEKFFFKVSLPNTIGTKEVVGTKEETQMKIGMWALIAVGALCIVTGLLKDEWADIVCGVACICGSIGVHIDIGITGIERKIAKIKMTDRERILPSCKVWK